MKSEALRNTRTMRQVKTGLEILRDLKLKTTNSLFKTREEVEYLESLTSRDAERLLEKEIRRFAAQKVAIGRSRQRVLRAREKLAMTINKNRALTDLRRRLQQTHWEGNHQAASRAGKSGSEPKLRRVELRY